ncbi:MAG: response regulator [Candidatus Heimdallarchaeota archaeon]|nr:response regulator [Candidatus Heimdallarchaeota archaeon]
MSEPLKKILVVDDEADTLELIQAILAHEKFQVLKALNGNEALELITENPDLILLDVKMPGGLSGLDICHLLKSDTRYRDIPIIIFSAKVLDQDIKEGLNAGAIEYITKPFSSKNLIRLIYKHIK